MSYSKFLRQLPFSISTVIACAVMLAGCETVTAPRSTKPSGGPSSTTTTPPRDVVPEAPLSPAVQRLANEAKALRPLVGTALGEKFLTAVSSLPPVAPRTVLQNPQTREYFSPAEAAALPEAARSKLVQTELDEYRYYYTKYGSPLAYMRALDIVSQNVFDDVSGKRILDFGYGSIGHLRILASLGADMTGVDPDSYLDALYSDPRDQGTVRSSQKGWGGRNGSVTLVHQSYPKDAIALSRVGQGYDLIVSKNTLKRGYIKPERKADKRQLIDLGASDDAFLKTLYAALNPGGKILIYNLYPKQSAANEQYKPHADGRSPFSREQYEKAGFRVQVIDQEDHAAIRKIGRALKWDQNDKGETIDNLDTNLFAMFTLVQKPGR